MPWARFADDYLGNVKLATMSTSAIALDMAAIIYSARELRDGHLSVADVHAIAALIHLKTWKPAVTQLVQRCRWVPLLTGDGWDIHDYLEYQPSREQVLAERTAAADRKRRQRSANGTFQPMSRRDSGVSSPGVTTPPYPVPDPDPSGVRRPGSSPARARPPRETSSRGSPAETEFSQPQSLRPEQSQCPLCPEVFSTNAELREHLDTSPRHKVNAQPMPGNLGKRFAAADASEPTRADIEAELASLHREPATIPPDVLAEHERILAMERSRNGQP